MPPITGLTPNTASAYPHTRAYLESLLQRNTPTHTPSSSRLQRTPSTLSATSYKPQKPSALSSLHPEHANDSSDDDSGGDDHDQAQVRAQSEKDAADLLSDGGSSIFSSSPSSASQDVKLDVDSASETESDTARTSFTSKSAPDPISQVLEALNNPDTDDEDRIEKVRSTLEFWFSEGDGGIISHSRLDSMVLEVLHRHREDCNPTGAVFATALPARRPSSIRSFSGVRPWTPTQATSGGVSKPITPTSSISTDFPFPVGSGTASGSVSPVPGFNYSFASAWNSSGPFDSLPTSPTPAQGATPGVIGSGSPRASPGPWNRAVSPYVGGSPARDLFAAAAASSGASSSPISSIPPGLSSSRPASPSPRGSPRLNIAAASFKPRTASSGSTNTASGSFTSSLPIRGDLGQLSLSRRGSSTSVTSATALANKSHAGAGDDDDDEFSPFGQTSKADRSVGVGSNFGSGAFGRPISNGTVGTRSTAPGSLTAGESDFGWYSGSTSGTSAASSSGGYEPSPLSSAVNGEGALGGAGGGGLGDSMTPFDVLYAILAGSNAPPASGSSPPRSSSSDSGAGTSTSWTPEQVEDALQRNGWDVEATLAAIIDNGGKVLPPLGPASASRSPPAAPRSAAGTSPRVPPSPSPSYPIQHPVQNPAYRAHHHTLQHEMQQQHRPGNSGVAVMTRDSLQYPSQAASGGALRYGGGAGGSAAAGANGARAQSPSRQPPIKGGRVCRYFLAGECRRADCRFSHDVGRAICRFWLRGQCLNDPCSFLHDYDLVGALAMGINNANLDEGSNEQQQSQQQQQQQPDDFPELGLAPSGPKAQRGRGRGGPVAAPAGPAAGISVPVAQAGASGGGGGVTSADPSRSRWSAAVQRSAQGPSTPLSQVQGGDTSYVSVHARAAPTGPRASRQSAGASGSGGGSGVGAAVTGSRSATRIPLHAPTLIPTLDTGRASAAAYASYRSASITLGEMRNKCLARASAAYKSHDGASAKRWSSEGQALNARMAEQSRIAATALVRERHRLLREKLYEGGGVSQEESRGRGKVVGAGLGLGLGMTRVGAQSTLSAEERGECMVDLHGLHAEEAVEMTEEFLLALEGEAYRGLAYLCIGMGKHTDTATDKRRVPLGKAVRQFLQSWGYVSRGV